MLKRNLIANYLGQGWSSIIGIIFTPLYINYLGIEAFALVGVFAILTSWFSLLDMGMSPTINREVSRFLGGVLDLDHVLDLLRSMETLAVLLALSLGIIMLFSADWLALNWFSQKELDVTVVAGALIVMAMISGLRFLESIYRGVLLGLQRHVLLNTVNVIQATTRAIGAIAVMHFYSPTIGAFFAWQGLISVSTLLVLGPFIYFNLAGWNFSGRFSFKALGKVKRYALGLMAGTLTGLLLSTTDKILLTSLVTLEEFGYYSLATLVIGALGMLVNPISQTIFPRFAELFVRNDLSSLASTFHTCAQMVSVLIGSFALVFIFYSNQILYAWTNDAEITMSTSPVLSLLCVAFLINSPMWILYQAQLAYGWTRLAVMINIGTLILILPTFLFLIPKYGMIGAGVSLIILNTISTFLHAWLTFRKILQQELGKWFLHDIALPLLTLLLFNLLLYLFSWQVINLLGVYTFLVLSILIALIIGVLVSDKLRVIFCYQAAKVFSH